MDEHKVESTEREMSLDNFLAFYDWTCSAAGYLELALFYAEKIKTVGFEEIKTLCLKNINPQILIRLIDKLPLLYFNEIKSFLKDETIDPLIRGALAKKIYPLPFQEVRDFLLDRSINYRVLVGVTSTIFPIDFKDLENFLTDVTKSDYLHFSVKKKLSLMLREQVCKELARKVKNISFTDIRFFLEDSIIPDTIRVALVENMLPTSFEEVKDFITDPNQDFFVQPEVADKIIETDFHHIQDILENNDVDFMTRAKLASKMGFINFKEVAYLLENTSLPEIVTSTIAIQVKPVSFEEVKNFLSNTSIYQSTREIIARKISSPPKHIIEEYFKNVDAQDIIKMQLRRRKANRNNDFLPIEVPKVEDYQVDLDSLFTSYTQKNNYGKQVNSSQYQQIVGSNNTNGGEIPEKRTLVIYRREFQGAYHPHFKEIVRVIDEYIKRGYSQVWGDIQIITRFGKISSVGGIETELYQGDMFRMKTSIFADTLHLSHGTPESKVPGTHFILGDAITSDQEKMSLVNSSQFTQVNLLYYGWENEEIVQKNTGDTGVGYHTDIDVGSICKRVLYSLQNAERKILQNSASISEKIDTILHG